MNAFKFLLSLPGGMEFIVLLFFGLAFLIFWIKCIVEIARSRFNDDTTKIVWLLIVILSGILGAVIYSIFGRNSRVINEG